MPTEADTVAAVLAAAAARHFGGPASIEKLARELGGASRQTWSFDAVVKGERHGLILRRDPPILRPGRSGKAGNERSTSLDRATEFRVLAAAHKAGVRAPEPLFELTAGDGLGEAYVMRRIGGTAIARKLLRDPPYEKARGADRGPARRDPGAHPCHPPGHAAAAGAPRSRRSHRRPAPLARPARPAAAGVRAGAVLARPAQARADRASRCWSMATTAPATTWPTNRA